MRKKILSIALCAAMVSSMAACGLKSPETTTAAAETTTAAAAAEETKAEAEAPEGEEKEAEAAGGSDSPAANDPQVTLVYAEVNPPESLIGQVDVKFKEEVERLSGGSIKIDLQASGVLGAEGDVLDNMLGGVGTIDMARVSVSTLSGYGVPKSTLLAIPYAFVDRDHFWKFAASDVAQEIMNETQEVGLGVRGLFYGEEGFRHIFTSKEISGIEDLAGLKIRVSTDPVMVNMINALGANATVVAYTELYTSLQTGVVDGAENPIANYQANAFTEVAPNLILDGHQLGLIEVIITDAAWDKLTDAQKDCMMEAAKLAGEYNKETVQATEDKVLDELRASGINVVEVPDKTPWVEACKDVMAEASKGYEDLFQKIVDLAN